MIRTTLVTICAVFFTAVSPVLSFTSDFESSEGYFPDLPLVGQTQAGIPWHGKPELCTVVSGEGIDGGQAVVLEPIGDFATVHILPPAEDLPTTLSFGIAVQLNDLKGGSFQVPVRLRVGLDGEAEALRLHFYEGGKIEFFSNGKAHRVKNEQGGDMVVHGGAYNDVQAEIDFAKGTYRLTINSVEQSVDGVADLPLMNLKERSAVGKFEITGSHKVDGRVLLDQFRWVTSE